MAFLTRAGNHLLTNKPIMVPAGQDIPALLRLGIYHLSSPCSIRPARERVTVSFDLQIPVIDINRSSGNKLISE